MDTERVTTAARQREGVGLVTRTGGGLPAAIRLRWAVASPALTVAGIFLLTIGGTVHFDRAELVHRVVPYLGNLFYLNALGTAAAVAGIALRVRGAWTLGMLVATPSAVLYVIAGTRGLPQVHLRSLSTQSGILCLVAEILYTLLWLRVARRDLAV
jgi:hypothetical protein